MICLKTYSKYDEPSVADFAVSERLPNWIELPCCVRCTFLISQISDYYVLKFTLSGLLNVTCQRCLQENPVDYSYSSEIVLCRSESRADELMSSYDCVVVEGDFLDLEAVIVDELHLSSPQISHESCQE